jgi:hypothetical protein
VIDDRERAVLTQVFSRVNEAALDPQVWTEIQRFKTQFEIP